jgi:hypothetical protein
VNILLASANRGEQRDYDFFVREVLENSDTDIVAYSYRYGTKSRDTGIRKSLTHLRVLIR